ncbi:MAG: aspartyl protease family protein [Deltaproteobacteria bacterium]|nr:aspartyl protease family protein [Nannocystaceae bacterium]
MPRSLVLTVAAALFACMPRGDAVPPEANPELRVPVVVRGGLVLVPVRLDGLDRELTMVLDTGAPTVLRTEIARELGLTMSATSGLEDAAGARLASTAIELPGVQVGAFQMRRVSAFAAELPDFAEQCVQIDGFLGVGAERGSGFLDRTAIEIDYAGQTIALARSGDTLAPGGSTVRVQRHELTLDGASVVMPALAEIELGGRRLWAILDTGNNGSISMTPGVFESLGRSFDEPALVQRTGALSQTAMGVRLGVSYEGRLDALGLGDMTVRGVPITVERGDGSGAEPIGARRILLGYHLLRNFRVVLDIAGGFARLVPVAGADPSAGARGLGFSWRDVEGKISVVTLVVGGPAARAGIAVGDELVAVDDVVLRTGDRAGQCEAREVIEAAGDRMLGIRVRHGSAEQLVSLRAEPVLPTIDVGVRP